MSGPEIAGSPLSRHDLGVLRLQLNRARVDGFLPYEFIVSSERLPETFVAFGYAVRPNDDLSLNEGLLLRVNREPLAFDFERSA